jgi:hypothetical protein
MIEAMPRKPKSGAVAETVVRVPGDLYERIGRLVEPLSARAYVPLRHSDAVRAALAAGCAHLERELGIDAAKGAKK